MSEKYVINIGRQFGAGGLEIAKKIAGKLSINYYDKNLIEIAAQKSGLGKELFENNEENPSVGFLGDLSGFLTNAISGGYYADNLLLNKSLFKIQSDIIRQLARKESCVFVGRCADYVLREHPRHINVFVCADMETRVRNVLNMRNGETDIEKITKEIEKTDKNRAKYYNFYTGKTWGAAVSYHLCVNSSLLGIEGSADLICSALEAASRRR